MKPTRIYAEMIDRVALEQFENAMSLTCNVQGALMPDAHAGYTLPIGAVIITPLKNNLNYAIILDGKNRRKKIITKRVV